MNIKRYKNAKWLRFEEIKNMDRHLIRCLFDENNERSKRFEKYVHSRITSLNPIEIEYFKEILLKPFFKLKDKCFEVYDIRDKDREQKTPYYRDQVEKHVNKMNKFFQDRFEGKPHFYLTHCCILNGDSKESGPQGLCQSILLEDFFEKI